MAGIYDRIKGTLGPGNNMSSNLLHAAYTLLSLGEFNDAVILAALNATQETPLSGQELTDLVNIAEQIDGQATTVDKIVYSNRLRATLIAVEEAGISDATFRSLLGIA